MKEKREEKSEREKKRERERESSKAKMNKVQGISNLVPYIFSVAFSVYY